MTLQLKPEQKTKAIEAIQKYFKEERDEEIGPLAAELLFDDVFKEVSPAIYNEAIKDASALFQQSSLNIIEDLSALEKKINK